MSASMSYCVIQGIPYLPNTYFPVRASLGVDGCLYYQSTGRPVATDDLGYARLDAAGLYVPGKLSSRKGQVGEFNIEDGKKSRRHSAMPRMLSRRISDSAVPKSFGRLSARASSGASLTGTTEEDDILTLQEILEGSRRPSSQKDDASTKARGLSSSRMKSTTDVEQTPSSFPSLFDQIKTSRQSAAASVTSLDGSSNVNSSDTLRSLEKAESAGKISVAHTTSVPDLRGSQRQSRRWSSGFPFGSKTTSSESVHTIKLGVPDEDEETNDPLSLLDFLNKGSPTEQKQPSGKNEAGNLDGVKESALKPKPSVRSPVSSVSTLSLDTGSRQLQLFSQKRKLLILGRTVSAETIPEMQSLSMSVALDDHRAANACPAWVTFEDYILQFFKSESASGSHGLAPCLTLSSEGCLALLDTDNIGNPTPGLLIIHQDGVVTCRANTVDDAMLLVSALNSGSSNIAVAIQLGLSQAQRVPVPASGEETPEDLFKVELRQLLAELSSTLREYAGAETNNATSPDVAECLEDPLNGWNPPPLQRAASNVMTEDKKSEELEGRQKDLYESALQPDQVNLSAAQTKPKILLRQISDQFDGRIVMRYEIGQDGITEKQFITAGTVDKLVERLADEHPPDPDYIPTFLLSYRHFLTAEELLTNLTARLDVQAPFGASSEMTNLVNRWRPVVRLRVINVVRQWLCDLWLPDFATPRIQTLLKTFIDSLRGEIDDLNEKRDNDVNSDSPLNAGTFPGLAILLKRIVNGKRAEHLNHHKSATNIPTTLVQALGPTESQPGTAAPIPSKLQFLELDIPQLARQLTLQEHTRFAAIRPVAFFLHLWAGSGPPSPMLAKFLRPIQEMIESFNQVSYWIATEICTQPEIKNRIKVVENCIKLAHECRLLHNYNTVLAIISGLNISAVSRLKLTWEGVFKQGVEPKRQKRLNELETLLQPTQNYRNYRNLKDGSERDEPATPFIPILSLLLKDLLFINDGNPTRYETGLINFGKMRMLYRAVQSCVRNQRKQYTFAEGSIGSDVVAFCGKVRFLNEATLYKYSCLCEAKTGADNTTIRLREKWMSQGEK
ncbi:ras guanine nucleotide exchange factor domain-containing protein [Phlyctochytrium arcticum]|nr:ras guanine nucleotide exchange factor domain-containing protein [Phlyctochytrium arcticum]